MQLSIVTTLYKSAPYIDEFYQRITVEAEKITQDYEIIFVDDGSPDNSLEKAVALHQQDSKVTVIELSRNFGHHKAIMTGLAHAKGDYVFLIDSDLEEEPELLGRFWQELHQDKSVDVVYGVQETRKGGWFERWSGKAFYTVHNFLSGVPVPRNLVTTRIFRRNAVNNLLEYKEIELCLGCIYQDMGLKQKKLTIKKKQLSPTTYSLARKISLAVNSIVSFSSKPLVYIFNIGLIITSISFIFAIKLIVGKLIFDTAVTGWTSILASIWLLGGFIILTLGIIGIYLSKIFIEVKNRPYTQTKRIFSKDIENE